MSRRMGLPGNRWLLRLGAAELRRVAPRPKAAVLLLKAVAEDPAADAELPRRLQRTLLMPDKLSQSEKKPKFEYMGEKKVLKDSMNTIELYHLNGVAHAEDMIIAYLPKIKTVVEADAFNAPAPNAPPPQIINGLER